MYNNKQPTKDELVEIQHYEVTANEVKLVRVERVNNYIQRPGNCPRCGYWDPFHGSWYSPDKEVADPKWAEEWDTEILNLCKEYVNGITIEHEDGDWWYHLTRGNKTLERFPLALLKVGLSPAERVGKTWRQLKREQNEKP